MYGLRLPDYHRLDLRANPQGLLPFLISILITIACLILLSHLAKRALAHVTANSAQMRATP